MNSAKMHPTDHMSTAVEYSCGDGGPTKEGEGAGGGKGRKGRGRGEGVRGVREGGREGEKREIEKEKGGRGGRAA